MEIYNEVRHARLDPTYPYFYPYPYPYPYP